jgi:Na+:H+ antiporter, NhaA family
MKQKRLQNPIRSLADSGKLGGILLILATIISLLLSNTNYKVSYTGFWESHFFVNGLEFSVLHCVNDGLMVVFFFLVGMEIKRELLIGELADKKKAMLPIVAAIGGMLFPGLIYALLNINDKQLLHGWAIPTATDIAFSLGVLSMLGNRVPFALKVFLTALAIIDDLGAIIVIAFFYTAAENFHPTYLLAAFGILTALFLLGRKKIFNGYLWLLSGVVIWFCILSSGVHATVAGVLVALTIPLEKIKTFEHALHKPVNYLILPLFALANTAITLSGENSSGIFEPVGLGIIIGLFIGKPLGISLLSYIAVKQNWCTLPYKINFKLIFGAGLIAGIGFTMSVFIATLSFSHALHLDIAKIAIIIGSLASGIAGAIYLQMQLSKSSM